MKTKFFKKLSFVLVVAMVLSVFAPAAGVFAAKAPKLNSTNKYLHLDVDGLNEYNFNISNKQKGWKYFWESADEDVAVVNEKNGVTTATGVGKTKITVYITDKDDEVVTQLSANVTVRDNIKEVKISNAPEGNKLAVGEAFDFNRSFVTRSGSTKKTSSITRWTVEPSDTAEIDDKGVFKATEAGKYTITALSFQSKARYESWLKDAETYKDYVLDTDSIEITVSASIADVKQLDVQKVKVIFDSAMVEDEVKENLKLSLLVGTVKSEQYIKSISLDKETKTEATVELYGPFSKGMTYVVDYPEMDSKSFKATSTNFSDVVRMTIDTKTAVVQKATEIKFTLYNKDDVDITDGTDSEYGGKLTDRVTFSTDSNGVYLNGNEITIFDVNTVAEVKATYNTYNYDDEGNEIGTVRAVANIVGVREATVPANSLVAYTVTTGSDKADFEKVNHRVAIGADNPVLHAQVKDTDDNKKDSTTDDNFTFESSNDNVLFVAPNGNLYPVKEGSVVVIVKYGDTIVGYANVTVLPEAKTARFTLSEYGFTLSNKEEVADNKTIEMEVKDQYGNNVALEEGDIKITPLTDGRDGDITVTPDHSKKTLNFAVTANAKPGRVAYQIEVNGFKRTVNIEIGAPNEGSIRYVLEVSNIDLAIKDEDDLKNKLDVKLIGYAPNGVKTTPDIASKDNITITGPQENVEYQQPLYKVASGGAISKEIKTGTYKVLAKVGGEVVDTKYFTVTDNQKPAIFTRLKDGYYTKGTTDLKAIAAECFEIKIDGNEVKADNIIAARSAGIGDLNVSVYITEVDVKQEIGKSGAYIVHTVKIGRTVRAR